MATNEIFRDADHLSLPVPAGTKAGAPVRIGGLNGVTETDRANTSVAPTNADGTKNGAYNFGGGNPDGHASVWLKGAHAFVVDFAVEAIGDEVLIDPATNALGDAGGTGTLYGHALTTKSEGAGPLTVRIAN